MISLKALQVCLEDGKSWIPLNFFNWDYQNTEVIALGGPDLSSFTI